MRTALKLALLLPLFALMAPTGGFPSRPTFQNVTITNGNSGGHNDLVVKNTVNVNGANIQLVDGSGTPNKFIRADSGTFMILNSNYSAALFSISDIGGAQLGTPTGGDKGAGTINSTGYFINGVSVASSGTFTATLTTGCTTQPTATFTYSIAANIVVLSTGAFTCVSNSTAAVVSGFPAAISPVSGTNFFPITLGNGQCTNNSVTVNNCYVQWNGANSLLYGQAGTSLWTAAGTKSLVGGTITYGLQ